MAHFFKSQYPQADLALSKDDIEKILKLVSIRALVMTQKKSKTDTEKIVSNLVDVLGYARSPLSALIRLIYCNRDLGSYGALLSQFFSDESISSLDKLIKIIIEKEEIERYSQEGLNQLAQILRYPGYIVSNTFVENSKRPTFTCVFYILDYLQHSCLGSQGSFKTKTCTNSELKSFIAHLAVKVLPRKEEIMKLFNLQTKTMTVLDMCRETLPELKIQKSIKVLTKLANCLDLTEENFNLIMALFVFFSGKSEAFTFKYDTKTQLKTNSYLGKVFGLPAQYFQTMQRLIEGQIFKKQLIQKLEKLLFLGQQHQIAGMDPRLVKGIFVLATGETELLDSLSDLLNIHPEILQSCVLLSNLSQPCMNRDVALQSLSQSQSFMNMLQKISIPANVVITLLNYSFMETDATQIKEMLQLLQIQRNMVDLDLLVSILGVIKATRLKRAIRSEQPWLLEMQRTKSKDTLRQGISYLSRYFYGKNERLLSMAVSLYFGDFKVLRDHREFVAPLLPSQFSVNLAMGLAGVFRSPMSHVSSKIKLIENQPITFQGATCILQSLLGLNPVIFKLASFDQATYKLLQIKHNFSKNIMVQIVIALSNLPLDIIHFLLQEEFRIRFSQKLGASYGSVNQSRDGGDVSLSKIHIRDLEEQANSLDREFFQRCNIFALGHIFKSYDELLQQENCSERCFNFPVQKARKILGRKRNWKNLQSQERPIFVTLLALFRELGDNDSKPITLGQLILAVLLVGVRRTLENQSMNQNRNYPSIMADLNLALLQIQFETILQEQVTESSGVRKIDLLSVLGLALKMPVAQEMEKSILPSLYRPDIFIKVKVYQENPLLGTQDFFRDVNELEPLIFQKKRLKQDAMFEMKELQILESFNKFNPSTNYPIFAQERERVKRSEPTPAKNLKLGILECLLLQNSFLNFVLKLADYHTVMSVDFQNELLERNIVSNGEAQRLLRALIVLSQVEQMVEEMKNVEERSILPDIKSELHTLLQNIPIDLILTEAVVFLAQGSRENYHLSSLGNRLIIDTDLLRTFFASSISNEQKHNSHELKKFLEPLLLSLRNREELSLILFEIFYGLSQGWEALGLKLMRNIYLFIKFQRSRWTSPGSSSFLVAQGARISRWVDF